MASATSNSESSPKNRSETTSRYGSGSCSYRVADLVAGLDGRYDARRVAGLIGQPGLTHRIQLGGRTPLLEPPVRLALRYSQEPGADRSLPAVATDGAKRGHEALLGHIFGVVGPPEDTQAGAVHDGRLVLDDPAEGVAVSRAGSIDEGVVIHAPIVP